VEAPRVFSGRRTLPEAAAFWVLAVLFLMLFFASAAASPLYPVYQAQFRFSAATLTAVFAVYVLVLLVTLLFFGSVSDYLGRLPVIITALVFSAAGCALFLAAHGVGTLYAARALQGIATGLATGPIGAALIDLQPSGSQRAPLVTSAFSTLGLALGALITSALAQYAPAPTHLIWWALLAVFAAGTLAVLAMAEPGSRRPGVLASLRPVIAVPRRARGTFAGAIPCLVATWALGGLYLSLGPSLATAATGSPNLIWGGLVIFLLCGTGAAAAYVLRAVSSRAAMLTGCLLLLAGVAVTFGAIATTASAAFLAGTTIAGAGFGLAFQGAFRMTTALATPAQRAGLVTAVFAVGYLAFSVPALIAGVATTKYGLRSTALVYSASLAALVVAAAGILVFRPGGQPAPASRAVMPPGPCTSPPCPQAMDAADGNLSTTAQARRLALARATERAVQMSGLLSVKWLPSIWQTRLQANVISWIVGRIGREVQRTPCSTVSRGVRLSEADVTAAPACGSARYMSTRDTSGRSHRPGWRDLGIRCCS
jgi:MFS family permease